MGLTISYTLSTPRKLANGIIRQLAERTAAFALKMGCAQVSGPNVGGPDHWIMRTLPDGDVTGDAVKPLSGWSVSVLPGEGSESADFGLCRYPGVKGWKLTSWCKTQYAARHGLDQFLACHRRIISLLDLWRDLGINVEVGDEGEFWQTRSIERLRERLGTYDRLVAAVAGTFKDRADEQGIKVKAEIFNDSRFERLEAEGRAEFSEKLEEMRKLLHDGEGRNQIT